MKKEVLLYGGINEYSARDFVQSIIQAEDLGATELVNRINSNGGNPQYMWSMASKFKSFEGKKTSIIEGNAHSSAFMFLAYSDNNVAYKHTEMAIHRAAYPGYFEKSENFTQELKDELIRMNKSLRSAIEARIDVEKFEKIKGVTMNEVFSMDARITVYLTATDAKKIGLIDKVIDLTKEAAHEIDAIAANYDIPAIAAEFFPESHISHNSNNMDVDKLKNEHPAVFASIFEQGVSQERDRVQAYMVFSNVDIEAVKSGIADGKSMSQKEMTELTMKSVSQAHLAAIAGDSTPPVKTPESTPETDAKTLEGATAELSDVEKLFAEPTAAILNSLKAEKS